MDNTTRRVAVPAATRRGIDVPVIRRTVAKRQESVINVTAEELRKEILWAVNEDKTYRCKGVMDGVYMMEEVLKAERYKWDSSPFPTVVHRSAPPPRITTSLGEFKERFFKIFPLEGFDLKGHGFVAAGSAVTYGLTGTAKPKDLDLFMVHKTDEESVDAINKFLGFIARTHDKSYVYRTKSCITIVLNPERRGQMIQIILRRYCSLAEIIHGFDLGSSAVAFDGENVFLTALGVVAIKFRLNILNMVVRRATYEKRIAKYFNERYFGIVLPDLDTFVGLNNRDQCVLPYIRFENCDIDSFLIRSIYACAAKPNADDDEPLYDNGLDYHKMADIGVENLRYPNILGGWLTPDFDFLKMGLAIETGRVACAIRNICNRSCIRVQKLKYIFGEKVAADLADIAIKSDHIEAVTMATLNAINEIIEVKAKGFDIPFKIMGVEEGTSLTGPFLREVVTKEQWYGKYYRASF